MTDGTLCHLFRLLSLIKSSIRRSDSFESHLACRLAFVAYVCEYNRWLSSVSQRGDVASDARSRPQYNDENGSNERCEGQVAELRQSEEVNSIGCQIAST